MSNFSNTGQKNFFSDAQDPFHRKNARFNLSLEISTRVSVVDIKNSLQEKKQLNTILGKFENIENECTGFRLHLGSPCSANT